MKISLAAIAAPILALSMTAAEADYHRVDCVRFEDALEAFEWAGRRALESQDALEAAYEAARAEGLTGAGEEREHPMVIAAMDARSRAQGRAELYDHVRGDLGDLISKARPRRSSDASYRATWKAAEYEFNLGGGSGSFRDQFQNWRQFAQVAFTIACAPAS